MDISSSSPFKQSISSSPEGIQGKDVSKERIQSVEPEIESLGAVGGKGVSSVPHTERSAETVSSTDLDIDPVKEKSKKLFYGNRLISPVTEFTEAYLDGIIGKTVELLKHMKEKPKYVPAKFAALRVQTLIVKMIRGDDSVSDMLPIIKSIATINKKECNSISGNILPLTDSHYLWPIMKDCEKGHGLGASFSSLGKQQQKLYVRKVKAYLDTIKGCHRYTKRILTAKEKSAFVIKLVNILKEIKRDGEEDEKRLASVVDKDEKIKLRLELEHTESAHYFVDEEIIALIDTSNPGLRSVAEKHKYFIMPHGLIEINAFEKKLLACYNLCVTQGGESCDTIVDSKPLFFLDCYKELLRDELNGGEITAFEGQQIACVWMMTLTKYFRLYQNYGTLETRITSVKDSGNQEYGREGKRDISISEAKLGRAKCLELTMWAQKNGFFNLAVYAHLQTLAGCVFMETKDLQSTSGITNKLLMDLMEHANDAAIVDRQKRQSYSNYMSLCERSGNKEKFDEALDIASQYSLLPMVSEIWNNLGLSVKNHAWITQKKLRPEYVINYLIKLVEQKETLILIKENIDATVEDLHAQYKANVISDFAFSPVITFYCYIAGEEETGKALLQYGQQHLHLFFVFLSLIANKKFKDAIALVDDVLKKVNIGPKEQYKIKVPKNNVLAILALVYKRLADTVSGDEKTKYLQQALSYLYEPAFVHKELCLSRAIIQEQLNDLSGAYDSYNTLEKHCKTFPDDSTENCQLHFISQAKETLRERLIESSKNESLEESPLQELEKDGVSIKKPKPKPKPKQKQPAPAPAPAPKQPAPEQAELEKILTVSLTMGEASETGVEINASEKFTQRDNDESWTVVERKKVVSHLKTPYDITHESVELAMSSTKYARGCLYMELLQSADIDYDELLRSHDKLYDKVGNITIKQVIFQNKMWSIRHKTFNTLALDYESCQSNTPVYKIKAKLRKNILESLYSNIECVIKYLTSETLPTTWRKNPESIFTSEKVAAIFADKNTALRLCIQFGAQCSTMAHVMRDVACDVPRNAESMEYVLDTFGITKLSELNDLSKLFYNCRNRIDPGHATRSID